MKKNTRIKEKKEEIKYNKLNKGLNITLFVILALYLIISIVMYFNDNFSYFIIKNIFNPINGFFYFLNSHINYLSYIIMAIYILVIITYIIVYIYNEIISKKSLEHRTKIVNIAYSCFMISIFIIVIPTLLGQFESHLPHFDKLYFKDTQNKTYTKEELIELDKYLQSKVLTIGDSIKRVDGKISNDRNYNKLAVKNLKNVSNKIPLLKGLYPTKSSSINDQIRGIVGSKVTGFTTPYSTYFDYSGDPVEIINTVTHEFCHTKGILRESETVYCAFLAGIESDDELSNYGAYIEAFSWVSEALMEIDYETSVNLEDEVLSKCLKNNYEELCSIYTKNNKSYIAGSKILSISSYHLKNYTDYKEELMESLKILKDNGAKILVDKKEVSLDDIDKLIDEKSNSYLNINMKLNKKIFNKIEKAIKNDKLYLGIYQINKEDEDSEEKEDNPEKYYLSPLKDKDENIFLNFSYGSIEYDYSRASRLILEHFDKYGYEKTSN